MVRLALVYDVGRMFSAIDRGFFSVVLESTSSPKNPPATSSDLSDIANLALQISVAIVTVVSVAIVIVAFFGVREVRDLRKLGDRLRIALRESEDAKSDLERRLASFEENFESLVLAAHLFNEGQTAYSHSDYDRAIAYFEQALALQPDNSRIHIRIARSLTNKGMNSRAERHLRIALKKYPNDHTAWIALATIKRYVDLPEAIRLAEKATELDPSSVEAWNYLGLLLRDAGRFEESLSAHSEARRQAPLDAVTRFYQALVLLRTNSADEAKHAFYEAFAYAQELLKTNQMRRMWALVIEWVYRRSIDTVEGEEAAIEISKKLEHICEQKRNRQTVIGHLVFYLNAKNIDPLSDAALDVFPDDEVRYIVNREIH